MGEAVSQPSPEIRRVAIIGAGVAGRSFALACVAAGFDVVLEDVMPANLWRAEAEYSDLSARVASGSLELASTVEDAVRTADIAVDFVPDELESKLEIFSMIDRMAPPGFVSSAFTRPRIFDFCLSASSRRHAMSARALA